MKYSLVLLALTMPLLGCATAPRPSLTGGRPPDLPPPPLSAIDALSADCRQHAETCLWVTALEKHLEVQDAEAGR